MTLVVSRTRFITQAERAQALDANYRSWFERAGELPGCELTVFAGFDVLSTPYSFPLYNVAMCTNLSWAADNMSELAAHFAERRVAYRIYAGEMSPAAERLVTISNSLPVRYPCLATEVRGRGDDLGTLRTRSPGHVRRARSVDDIKVWASVVGRSFGIPDAFVPFLQGVGELHGTADDSALPLFIGYRGDEAVAASSVYFAGGAAAIYCVATIPSARTQGFASAVTVAAVEEVLRRGHDWVGGCASPMGLPVYERLGAETISQVLEMYPSVK